MVTVMTEKKKSSQEKEGQPLDERYLELTSLFEISRSLTSSLSIRSILENILRIPMGYMLISRGVVLLREGEGEEFVVEEIRGFSRNLIGKSMRIDCPPDRSVLVHEIDPECQWREFFKEFGLELLLPLNSSQGIIGIVGFGNKIGDVPYKEREIEFLNSLSNIAATAVTNGLVMEDSQRVNRTLDRKIQQLNTIFDIGRELNITLDQEKIGSLLSFAVMGELLVNKCVVYIRRNNLMEVLVAKGLTPPQNTPEKLCDISQPVLLEDTDRFAALQKAGLALLVPMRLQDETKGLLALSSKISGTSFDEEDLEFLTTLGNQATSSLENARLFEEALEKQRMEEELNLARNIQQKLLPSELPTIPRYEIAAVNLPSRQVGGDYYDVFLLSEHVYGIAIADVSGKGAGAALLMAYLQASMQALAIRDVPLEEMVGSINDLIHRNTDLDKFITFFYGLLDWTKNTFTYCNAGHNPPYHVRRDGTFGELMAGGIVLGMMSGMHFESATIQVEEGDWIVMFTDGITEAMNPAEEEFGEKRLLELIRSSVKVTTRDMLDGIVTQVEEFAAGAPQADDITLVTLHAVSSGGRKKQ
jgi:sigma-B regulation protein RsbU (phosphoserine phosphatase)